MSIQDRMKELNEKLSQLQSDLADLETDRDRFDPSDYIDEDDYDAMLDDCYGPIDVCGIKYGASDVLKAVDPIAYRCGLSDYCGSFDQSEYADRFPEYAELLERIEEIIEEIEGEIEDVESELDDLAIEFDRDDDD